jgi:diadenosine tetraphosphate (Ap4A) HIT family hydrolase
LLESENFVVIPSLGSLVEGWVLIVPKKHFICIGALPADLLCELEQTKTLAAARLGLQYGQVCAFEHGPHAVNRQAGCGVDHAHLHVLPLDFDLRTAAEPFAPPELGWAPATLESCRTAFHEGQDYLFVEQPIGNGFIASHRELGSQVLRRAIASRLGVPDQFNWREHPHTEVISRTIQALTDPGIVAV